MSRTLAAYDYKYEIGVWRADVEESFQIETKVQSDYTVADGQIVQQVDTTWEYQSAIAQESIQLPGPPVTFLYIDGTYRADAAYIFQKTHIKTTTYQAYGDSSYLVTIEDRDVLNNKVTRTTSIIDGKIPLAPTQSSALSNLIQQPISGVLEDNCGFAPATTIIDNIYLEDSTDAAKVARRQLQRDTAIVRRVKHGANPLMRLGQTIRLVDEKRGLDGRHVLTRRTIEVSADGAATETLEMEFWVR
jgi:hypothetical protein